jgi:CubicO group peptidase (beta-lactamase class C family)
MTSALVSCLLILSAGAERPTGDIAGRLQLFVDSHTLAGAVTLVASKDRVLSLEAVGYADVAARKPMATDALFWIASMSKPMTAAAFMALVDEGKVKVDDPVEKYLPEFRDVWLAVERDNDHILLKRPRHKITVKHLLTHTSGLPFASRVEGPELDHLTLRDGARSYVMTPLLSEPGSKWAYSNAGINTAGRIIEVVSGMPYEKFMQKRLFDPLGMKDTTFWPDEKQLARLAKSYRPNRTNDGLVEIKIGQLRYPLNDHKRQPMPAGGLFSTATDVSNFCRMVLAGGVFEGKRVLSEKAVRQMTSSQTGDLPQSYGLGWATGKKSGGTFGHGGAYRTDMTVDPRKGLVMVFLVQHDGYPGKDGDKIRPTFVKAAVEKYGK